MIGNEHDADELAYCEWCNDKIGYRIGGMPFISRISHMKNRHPIRNVIAFILAPLFHGDLLFCPVVWKEPESK